MIINVLQLYHLWHMPPEKMPTEEIARRLGVSKSTLHFAARREKLPMRPRFPRAPRSVMADPTEQEIAERAAEIRSGWPEGESERRWVGLRAEPVALRAFTYDGRIGSFSGIDVDP